MDRFSFTQRKVMMIAKFELYKVSQQLFAGLLEASNGGVVCCLLVS